MSAVSTIPIRNLCIMITSLSREVDIISAISSYITHIYKDQNRKISHGFLGLLNWIRLCNKATLTLGEDNLFNFYYLSFSPVKFIKDDRAEIGLDRIAVLVGQGLLMIMKNRQEPRSAPKRSAMKALQISFGSHSISRSIRAVVSSSPRRRTL